MMFDLSALIQPLDGLDCLEEPFSIEEINQVIIDLPSDKSPGPNGFNTDFLKKC
jgi:hypothetical protein